MPAHSASSAHWTECAVEPCNLKVFLKVTVLPFCLQADEVEMGKKGPKMRRVSPRSKHQCKMLGVTDLLQPDKTRFLLLKLLHLFGVLAQLFCCPEVLKPSASQRVVRTGERCPPP